MLFIDCDLQLGEWIRDAMQIERDGIWMDGRTDGYAIWLPGEWPWNGGYEYGMVWGMGFFSSFFFFLASHTLYYTGIRSLLSGLLSSVLSLLYIYHITDQHHHLPSQLEVLKLERKNVCAELSRHMAIYDMLLLALQIVDC